MGPGVHADCSRTSAAYGFLRCLVACAFVIALGAVNAQALPDAAADALARAQAAAATANLTYERHFPDQRLWREAIAAGQEARSLAPDHPAPHRFLAQAYATVQWYSRAWDAWEAYRRTGGVVDAQAERHLVTTATWLGVTAFDAGRREEALPYLETVLQYAPRDVGTRDRLATWHLDRGEDAEALPHLRVLAEEVSADYDERLALTLRRVEHGAAASEAFDEGVRSLAEGRFEDAIDALRSATRQAPTFGEAWLALADALLESERLDEAVEAYRGAIEFQAGPAALSGLELALARLEAEEEAAALAAAPAAPPEPAAEALDVPTPPTTAVQPPPPAPDIEPVPPAAPEPAPPAPPEPTPAPTPAPEEPEPVPPPTPAPPLAPLTLVDADIEHRPTSVGGSGGIVFVRTPELERDLGAYEGGTLHQRLEVVTKPSEVPVRYQLCLVHSNIALGPVCTDASRLSFDREGVFTAQQALGGISGADAIAWQRGITSVMLVVREPGGAPVDDRTIPSTPSETRLDMSLYFPMQVRLTAVLVPPGGSPPAWP